MRDDSLCLPNRMFFKYVNRLVRGGQVHLNIAAIVSGNRTGSKLQGEFYYHTYYNLWKDFWFFWLFDCFAVL